MADFSSGSFVKRQIINKIKINWVHSLHCWMQYSLPHSLHILANVVGFPVFHACRKFAYSEIKTYHHIYDAQKCCLGSCWVGFFKTQMKYKKNCVCVSQSQEDHISYDNHDKDIWIPKNTQQAWRMEVKIQPQWQEYTGMVLPWCPKIWFNMPRYKKILYQVGMCPEGFWYFVSLITNKFNKCSS